MLGLLLEAGAPVDAILLEGMGPLERAVSLGSRGIDDVLKEFGLRGEGGCICSDCSCEGQLRR